MRGSPLLLLAAAAQPARAQPPPSCSDCHDPASQALWWRRDGLNCPAGNDPGCNLCGNPGEPTNALCETANSPAKCCELCHQWNTGALPEHAKGEKAAGRPCEVWYFNGVKCLLKDGAKSKAAFRPEQADAYVSGPGCVGGQGEWGLTFLVLVAAGGALYVGGGVQFAATKLSAPPALRSHPHYRRWLDLAGLVADGVQATTGNSPGRRANYRPVPGAPSSRGGKAKKPDKAKRPSAAESGKSTNKEKKEHRGDGGGGGELLGETSSAAAVGPAVASTASGGRWVHMPTTTLMLLLLGLADPRHLCSARLSLPAVPPKGWEDFDSHRDAAYNETYARAAAAVMGKQMVPLGFTDMVIGGWSAGGVVDPGGAVDNNATHHYVVLDEFSRPVPDAVRFPSAAVTNAPCSCMPRNCSVMRQWQCTDPVCVCPAGSRSLRPFSKYLTQHGLRLGLWTWRGVHAGAVALKLRVKGTPYTADQIVERGADGSPCITAGKECPANCGWGPWLGLNTSHPGARAYYDSFYSQVVDDWGVAFVKTDCQDPARRWDELALQSDAANKTKGDVALSIAPGPFLVPQGSRAASTRAVTMYRVTGDFYGRWNQLPQEIAAASAFANASLLGAGGTYPDLDMMPMGQIVCDLRNIPATTHGQQCGCDNCNGWYQAKLIASLWAIARSPLLIGGALPLDDGVMKILSQPDFLMVHTFARNQTVIEYTQPSFPPPHSGWVKWTARFAAGADKTAVRAVLVINAGNVSATTTTRWSALGLTGSGYVARDVWSGEALPAVVGGFTTTVGRLNGTLIVVRRAGKRAIDGPPMKAGTATLSNVALPLDQNGEKLITGEADVLKHGDTYFLYFNNFGNCPGVDCCKSSGGCASCCFADPPSPYLPGCGAGNATPGDPRLTHEQNSSDPYGFYHTVQVYSTTDFKIFDNLGVALPLAARRFGVEFRPHVVYNAKQRLFVMWFENRLSSGKGGGYSVAVSHTAAGPFVTHDENVTMPGPGEIGDFDIFVDDDGSAYHVRTGLTIVKLNGEFTGPEEHVGDLSSCGRKTEAPILFKRRGRYYVLAGACCCICTGGSNILVMMADSIRGPWTCAGDVGSNPARFDAHSPNNYVTKAQASAVFEVTPRGGGTAQYVWLGNQFNSGLLQTPPAPRSHDLLYWAVLQFHDNGTVKQLVHEEEATLEIGL